MIISTIIPAYKNIDFILPAVRSVFTSEKYEHQVIIVDDGNDSDVAESLRAFGKIPEVEVVRLEKNLGLANARNEGFKKAKGDIIRFLDADDEFTWSGLEAQLDTMITRNADVVVGAFILIDNYNQKCWNIPNNSTDPLDLNETFKSFLFYWERGLSIPIHSAIFKKIALEKIPKPIFPADFRAKEDWIFWCNLAQSGAKFELISDVTALYRQHGSNMCVTDVGKMGRAFLEASFHLGGKLVTDDIMRGKFLEASLDHFFNYYVRGMIIQAKKNG